MNAASDYHASQASIQALAAAQGCFALHPCLRLAVNAQRGMISAGQQAAKARILNAIHVWRDDLKGERFVIDGEEIAV
jgi:hypothetical protein